MTAEIDAALSTEFVAAALQRPVDELGYERIGVDRGFAGVVLRLTVRAHGRAATTVVAKVGPDPSLDREVHFYREIAGQAAPAPRCRYAGPAQDGTPVVLLQDHSTARSGDALAGASVDDVAAVLASMAPVWRHPATDPTLAGLPVWGGDPAARQARFRVNWAAQRAGLCAELSDQVLLIGDRLCDRLAAVVTELQRAPASVLHADLHLDNVLFDPAAGERPIVLDWGSTCVGPAAVDVFPFLAMSLSPEDHRDCAADLLADAGLGDDAIDDGRRRLLCYFAGVVGWRNRPPGAQPRERALCAAALADGRLINALLQWDAAGVL